MSEDLTPKNFADLAAEADFETVEDAEIQAEPEKVIHLDAERRKREEHEEQPKKRARWLDDMNARYCVTMWGKSTVIADLKSDPNGPIRRLRVPDWKIALANEFVADTNGKLNPKSETWLHHKKRHQRLQPGVVFEPGAPERGALNLWRGFAVEPKKGDWSLMQNHILEILCNGNEAHYHYVLRWIAYNVQHPENPARTVLVFVGAEGAGKGVVLVTFGGLFGPHFLHLNDSDQIVGRFNADLGTAVFAFLDEAFWGGDKKGADKLRSMITEERLTIEQKGIDRIHVRNHLSFAVASNKEWAMPVAVGDRRYAVFQVNERYAHKAENPNTKMYFDGLWAEVRNGGQEAMLYDLWHMDLTGFNILTVPKTKAKTEMMIRGLNGSEGFVKKWLFQILSDGWVEVEPPDTDDLMSKDMSKSSLSFWTKDGLTVNKEALYDHYSAACKAQNERPLIKDLWAKALIKVLGEAVNVNYRSRKLGDRERHVRFGALDQCRRGWDRNAGTSGDGSVWPE